MATLISFGLCILAVYRVSYMLTQEEGPFSIFANFRGKFNQSDWLGRGLNCILCVSFWLSVLPAIYLAPTVIQFFLYWFAIAGAVTVLHKWLNRH